MVVILLYGRPLMQGESDISPDRWQRASDALERFNDRDF